jgi:hypothetical protein
MEGDRVNLRERTEHELAEHRNRPGRMYDLLNDRLRKLADDSYLRNKLRRPGGVG